MPSSEIAAYVAMDTFLSCDPNTGWPYFADENLEPDRFEGLQLVVCQCSWCRVSTNTF
jgi:hypothetical protein